MHKTEFLIIRAETILFFFRICKIEKTLTSGTNSPLIRVFLSEFQCNICITYWPELRSILKLCCASMDLGYYQYPFTQLLRNQFFIYLSASLLIRTQFRVYAIPDSRKFPTLATSLCRKSSSTCVYDTVVE